VAAVEVAVVVLAAVGAQLQVVVDAGHLGRVGAEEAAQEVLLVLVLLLLLSGPVGRLRALVEEVGPLAVPEVPVFGLIDRATARLGRLGLRLQLVETVLVMVMFQRQVTLDLVKDAKLVEAVVRVAGGYYDKIIR